MKKIFKWLGISVGGIIILLLLSLGVLYIHWRTLTARPILGPDGKTVPGSVSVMEQLSLGGVKQTIYIRGMDRTRPVVLFLHGGPGSPESMMVKHFNGDLEKHYIVVNWDQRGAGRSYSPFISSESMNPGQFVSDAIELTEHLRKRFSKEKIYLVGHSWGSILGVYTIRKRPDLYYAYIGIGQVVNLIENERLSYAYVLDQARRRGDVNAVKELEGIRDYYLPSKYSIWKIFKQRSYLAKYGGVFHGRDNYSLLFEADTKGEYSLFDLLPFFLGGYKSISEMWPELMHTVKLEKTDTIFNIPVYFFTGAHDYNVPFELTEKYFRAVKAPRKGLVWFNRSAHMAGFEEPEKFNTELMKVFR